jgi:succinate-acetate transporter protein
MTARNPPGTGMLRLSAAVLFVAGPIVALIFRSWGLGVLVFGLGAIVLGIRQVRLGGHRSERFLGVALLLGGAFTLIDGVVRLLLGASP